MYTLRGFISLPDLIDNAVGSTAPLGELSKHSSTFSRETGYHQKPKYPKVGLYSFTSETDHEAISVPNDALEATLRVADWLYQFSVADQKVADNTFIRRELEYFFSGTIENVTVGHVIDNGREWLPEWVAFSLSAYSSDIRIWLSDEAFQKQYTDYSYAFIAPVDDVDVLFQDVELIQKALAERDFIRKTEIIEEKRGDAPFTYLKATKHRWVDVQGKDPDIYMDWTVLIYGEAGNHADKIRRELANWILSKSKYKRENWMRVLPTIFSPTEFIVTPLWSQYAIANKSIQSGIHSPLLTPQRAVEVASLTAKGQGYDLVEVGALTTITTIPYKSLSVMFTGNAQNLDNRYYLEDFYPDYISVSLQSRDFSRMSPKTQTFVRSLNELLYMAERYEEGIYLPRPYLTVKRGDVTYIHQTIDDVSFMVVTRESMARVVKPNSDWYDDRTDDDCLIEPLEPINEQAEFTITSESTAFIKGKDTEEALSSVHYTIYVGSMVVKQGSTEDINAQGEWRVDINDLFFDDFKIYELRLEYYNSLKTKYKEGTLRSVNLKAPSAVTETHYIAGRFYAQDGINWYDQSTFADWEPLGTDVNHNNGT